MAAPAGNDNLDQAHGGELLYGLHAIREALRAGTRPLVRVIVARDDRRLGDLIRLARSHQVPVHVEPRPALDRLVPSGKHQGVVALVAAKRYSELEEALHIARERQEPPLIVVLDGVEDPRNLGAVLRTAEAAGVHGVIVPERRAAGLTPTVAKASAGALEHLPVIRAGNLNRVTETLKAENLWVYGLDPDAKAAYTELDYRGAIALVFGGEGKGIRPSMREKCDGLAKIPMRGRVSSLNVSAAAAIVLFETIRQRTGRQGASLNEAE